VFRFASLLAIARKFETHAFYINSRIAKDRETEFLRYAKSFVWVMTHPELTPKDDQPGRDHFRNDEFRPMLDLCYLPLKGMDDSTSSRDGMDPISDWRRYWALLEATQDGESGEQGEEVQHHGEVEVLLKFFDGLDRYDEVRAESETTREDPRRRLDARDAEAATTSQTATTSPRLAGSAIVEGPSTADWTYGEAHGGGDGERAARPAAG
jgi:hypothetical protein